MPDAILPYARRADATASLTARGAAKIACRLIALWLFAQSVQEAFFVLGLFVVELFESPRSRSAGLPYGLLSLAVAFGPIVAGSVIWSAADWIARKVVPVDLPIGAVDGPDIRPVATVGLVMVGASTMAWAIHDLIEAAIRAAQSHATFALWWQDRIWLRAFASDLAVLGLAAWMIFGGRGIVRLIGLARSAGVRTGASDESHPTDH